MCQCHGEVNMCDIYEEYRCLCNYVIKECEQFNEPTPLPPNPTDCIRRYPFVLQNTIFLPLVVECTCVQSHVSTH